jgi:O-antigen/teichoic acid export membrane protein
MKRIKAFFNDPLFTQSSWMFGSSMLVNILNFCFWLIMVRKLSVEDYGMLNALVTVLMFLSIPSGILQTVITRYVSKFMAHDRKDETLALLSYFVRTVAISLGILFLLLLLTAPLIADFLKIGRSGFIHLIGLGLVFSYFSTITMGGLSGFQKFNRVAINSSISSAVKVALSFLLVLLGFRVAGALLGFVVSFLVTFGLSWAQLPKHFRKFVRPVRQSLLDLKEIHSYFLPVGLCMLCFFALTNMDMILVKHFFSPLEAGYYSVAQMAGKIVLFVPGAMGAVMFPMVIDSHTKKADTLAIVKKSLLAVGVLCGIATIFSFVAPLFILRILTGRDHPEIVPLVKFFALSMTFFALVNIFMLYNLSLRRMGYIYALLALTVLQILLICLWHANLVNVLQVMLLISIILFGLGFRSLFLKRLS